jgi:hypothetical protein
VVAIAVAVAAAVGGALALPGSSGARSSAFTSVTGSGKVTFPDFPSAGVNAIEQFAVSAHDGPHGPTGTIVVHSPLYSIDPGIVDVTCIVVNGNDAVVGGTFREPFTFLGSRISQFGIMIHDNGSPGAGLPDEIHPVEFVDRPRPPSFSPCNLHLPTEFPLDSGNYVLSG